MRCSGDCTKQQSRGKEIDFVEVCNDMAEFCLGWVLWDQEKQIIAGRINEGDGYDKRKEECIDELNVKRFFSSNDLGFGYRKAT